MVLLFGRLYELRAEEATEGGAKVVVVGPPGAGKITLVKQLLEQRVWRRTRYTEEGGGDLLKATGEELKLFAVEASRSAQKSGITYICVATWSVPIPIDRRQPRRSCGTPPQACRRMEGRSRGGEQKARGEHHRRRHRVR
jgi:hypothetical protein